MRILMHCSGMPFNGDTIPSGKSLGGSESAAYFMAKELVKLGHNVIVFTNQKEGVGFYDGVYYEWLGEVNDKTPLGHKFEMTCIVPFDVVVVQRTPWAFYRPVESKLNIWWLHDIALMRHAPVVQQRLVNVDKVFTVSEFHKKQVSQAYDIPLNYIRAVKNGFDYTQVEDILKQDITREPKSLVFGSRPERGLEALVKSDGIMEKLKDYTLYVCGYSNTVPQMKEYYEYLWQRCEQLPNVHNLGALSKVDLLSLMRKCKAYVYPTLFEDTSNMMVLEANSVGTPFIGIKGLAALPETARNGGVHFIPSGKKEVNIDLFIKGIKHVVERPAIWKTYSEKAFKKHQSWEDQAKDWSKYFENALAKKSSNVQSLYRHFEKNSDIVALWKHAERETYSSVFHEKEKVNVITDEDIVKTIEEVLPDFQQNYYFFLNGQYAAHYKSYYEYEKQRGVEYGPESLEGQNRFEHTSFFINNLKPKAVLDYGCAHGHYTMNLMMRYPDIRFFGVDINEDNIRIARDWVVDYFLAKKYEGKVKATQEQLAEANNIAKNLFICSTVEQGFELAEKVDLILLEEIIEHIPDPRKLINDLTRYLTEEGYFLISVPYGPWEAMGYKEHPGWRAHIHYFERQDIFDMFGRQKGFQFIAIPTSEGFGHYLISFQPSEEEPIGEIDYNRKLVEQSPRQTVSACLIACNEENTIGKTITSFKDVVDEIVVGVDKKSTDKTFDIAKKLSDKVIKIDSPLETGFAEARNKTISFATMDWIFWIDCDETLQRVENLHKYLRNNCYLGYGIKQHHYAVEPPELFKTDFPCRLFRNNKGLKFYGFVHEHPELKMNEGPGKTHLIDDLDIMHMGYSTENIRRKRFERNFPLMLQDQKHYPNRNLGKFLWIRDCAHYIRYALERNGGFMSNELQDIAKDGIKTWRDLLKTKDVRLILESIKFYSECVFRVIGNAGIEYIISITSSLAGARYEMPVDKIEGLFYSKKDLKNFTNILFEESVKNFDNKYF